ncbi:bifunctional diaminohydroxyphosphoribosylaminopyrimidine deaminase/5-amino-6-(5-phosphoribosylamino)uracil reductase RibD [Alkalihalobacillus macyae]|uniref:bifunctional diaminohydroxyphosphoribosylaminopyrimidine deaminase/5-amino-6-(5-phosphoribosylamino)uracil reductase RibD n=1 Tax=Guptibacillus hwajinpoensis TaxID=208199 RepID=UPI00273B43FD|nr:bifunctional diaminohydroxyphosphoribosylaminopyrimidine deaminase/5-amino-6-(5-phosphoribosylamino)uracil reductase RibD [Alkalihalobacillus macyae]MDP4552687.1 bifunctional diaminohydroxyphosphoribosylaminopyrimidine deaminase/5-amino-6-(5-phosphoribosylamino)uracil reductase RibD [Alkalihalobacillus macyae]
MKHLDYMRTAISMASATLGQTNPNPAVGAIIVNEGRIVGMGAHLRAGEGHAEVHALRMAGKEASGGTAYVTLEPCSHHGRTPPCADALIEAGIKTVYIASQDPNPLVSGGGVAKLREAGVTVEIGLGEEEALRLNKMFFHSITNKRPFVTLKSATTLDGKIATRNRDSKWITGEEARKDVHSLRHLHDAILVGVGTVISDNPSLTTRYGEGLSPIRVVLDHHLRIPTDSIVLTDDSVETWIVTTKDAVKKNDRTFQKHVHVIEVSQNSILIDEVLDLLGKRNITSLFVEGGSEIHGSFLEGSHFQQVITYLAPKLIGGRDAPTSFGANGFSKMSDAVNLTIESVEKIGEDIRVIATRKENA